MDRKVFTAILLSVLVVGLVYLAYRLFEPFLLSILWAAALAAVSHQGHEWLAARLGGRRTLAAALMSLLVFVLLVGPLVLVTLVLVDEAVSFANEFEPRMQSIAEKPSVAWVIEKAEELLHDRISVERIGALARERVGSIVARAGDAVRLVFGLLAGVVTMLLSLFFFYRDGPAIVGAARELMPMADADRDEVLADINGAINAAVRGGLVTAFLQGMLGFVIVLILGIGRPALLAAAMSLASFIPIVGTTLVWGPLALSLAFLDGEPGKATALAIYGFLVIGGADNLVRPILIGRHMEAHPLLLFFGVLGGIVLFGFAGIVLGPIVVAFLNVTARLLRRRFAAPAAT